MAPIQYDMSKGEILSETDSIKIIERFELLEKATHDVIWDWDFEKDTIWWSKTLLEVFGYDTIEESSNSWYSRIHPEDFDRVNKKFGQAISSAESNWSDYYRFRKADGTYAYVHDRAYTIRANGVVVRMLGSLQDISEQYKSREEKERSDAQLSLALKSANLGTSTWLTQTHEIIWDARYRELFYFTEDEYISEAKSFERIHPDDKEEVLENTRRCFEPGNDVNYNIQFRVKDPNSDDIRWVHCQGKGYFQGDVLYRFSGVASDVTEYVRSQDNAYYANQLAEMSIEGTGAGSYVYDTTTSSIMCSPTMMAILTGNPKSGMSEAIYMKHLHPADRIIRDNAHKAASQTGQLNYEARFIWEDGSLHWVRIFGRYLYDKVGQLRSLSGLIFDITEVVEAEYFLRSNQEYLKSMIEQAPVAKSLFVGSDFKIEIVNEAMMDILGKNRTIIGQKMEDAIPEFVEQEFLPIFKEVYKTGKLYKALGIPMDMMRRGQSTRGYYDRTLKPLLDNDGEVFAIIDMIVDVTAQVTAAIELKESEERYKQLADELEKRVQDRTNELKETNLELINSNNNLKQFAYVASHDMQEPLRKIQSFSSRLTSMYHESLDENGIFMLNRIQDSARRMSVMIDDLLTYSRLSNKEGEFVNVDLNQTVTNILTDLEMLIEEKQAQIVVEPLASVIGNPIQLGQLFLNVISNAIKYSVPGTQPIIKIACNQATLTEIEAVPVLSWQRNYAKIEVKDNGIGFDPKYLDRIFQMFQRLHGKSEYNGSGIGLALCQKVVQNHNGYITALSKPNAGSTFIIYLPIK